MHRNQIQELYELHGAAIYRHARRILQNDDEAYDACQDTFVRLVESGISISPQQPLPWLYRVATNVCIDKLRKHKHIVLPVETLFEQPTSASTSDARDLLDKLWNHLTHEEQTLLLLRYVDELSLEEMEEICNLTRKTISKRLQQLQKKARLLSQNQTKSPNDGQV